MAETLKPIDGRLVPCGPADLARAKEAGAFRGVETQSERSVSGARVPTGPAADRALLKHHLKKPRR